MITKRLKPFTFDNSKETVNFSFQNEGISVKFVPASSDHHIGVEITELTFEPHKEKRVWRKGATYRYEDRLHTLKEVKVDINLLNARQRQFGALDYLEWIQENVAIQICCYKLDGKFILKYRDLNWSYGDKYNSDAIQFLNSNHYRFWHMSKDGGEASFHLPTVARLCYKDVITEKTAHEIYELEKERQPIFLSHKTF